MGYPATGIEGVYRNSRQEVLRLFNLYHKDHVKIYNLCIEEKHHYDPEYFQTQGIKVAYFPMKDHHPTDFRLILSFCLDAFLYLQRHPKNVIAVHCKAGKGRTGSMICQFFVFMGMTYSQAIEKFNVRRAVDSIGLRKPSQIRFVKYFSQFVMEKFG